MRATKIVTAMKLIFQDTIFGKTQNSSEHGYKRISYFHSIYQLPNNSYTLAVINMNFTKLNNKMHFNKITDKII